MDRTTLLDSATVRYMQLFSIFVFSFLLSFLLHSLLARHWTRGALRPFSLSLPPTSSRLTAILKFDLKYLNKVLSMEKQAKADSCPPTDSRLENFGLSRSR